MKIKFNFVNMLKYNCYILIKINDILYWNIISIKNFQLLYLHLPTKRRGLTSNTFPYRKKSQFDDF